ncbi:MFS transporter [Altererythrobacter sp. BO-6]|uniref:MFS transporter n=1 Tax=Altererythrobacter sp. BO-6 TaxID=2604537 RepID=UPI0013E1868F|nr:MFS transporter [Altererythrobacter sp. BO-6]QIG53632.1 MFS transporter [Altererythrobacter sp. BO-6]
MAMVPSTGKVGLIPQLTWASGSFATGALFNAMALFALFFMTSVLGIGPAVAGTIILLARVYDGIIDPLIGAISDRTRHRWGARRIYLLIGALGLGASFIAFFNLSAMGVAGAQAGFLVTAILLLYSTAYSIFTIPYLAMPPEIAPGYDDRTRLMSFRVFFQLAGVMAGSVGAPALIEMSGGEQGGYQFMGLILGIAATGLCLIVFVGAAWLPQSERPQKTDHVDTLALLASPFTDMVKVIGNAPFRQLTVIKLCQLAVLSTVLACTPYFFGFVLKLGPAQIGQFYAVFGIAGIVSVPLYRWIIAKFGKRESYIALILLYAVALASWILWHPAEDSLFLFVRAVLIGSFSTGTLLCALAMLPDTMEYDRLQSGEAREGIMSGVWTFVENLAGALGPFIIGMLLQANGLIQSRDPLVEQPQAVLTAVHFGASIIPAVFCVIAVPILLRYRLDEAMLEQLRAKQT